MFGGGQEEKGDAEKDFPFTSHLSSSTTIEGGVEFTAVFLTYTCYLFHSLPGFSEFSVS